jgi:hypothetical protein
LDSLYALVGTLPVLAIPVLLGSVTPGEIWRTVVSLLATALFSVCAGMFVSALSVNERKSTAGTFLLIAFVSAGLPLLILIAENQLRGLPIQWLFALSPGTSITAALVNNPRSISWELYWASVLVTLLYSVIFAVVASIVVPRIWQQRVEDRSHRGLRSREWAQVRRERQHLLDLSPTCWLGGRGRLRGLWLWVFLVCVLAGWLWAYAEDSSNMLIIWMSLGWMFFVHGVIKIFVASEAVRTYSEDFKQGALELILCTPQTVREIIGGQLLNVFRYFRWPVVAVLAADLFLLVVGRTRYTGDDETGTLWFAALMVFFVVDCAAITVVGLWHGLKGRNSRQALTSTIVRILVLPWILYGMLNFISALLPRSLIPDRMQLPLLIVISLLVNGLFAWRAWEHLHQDLRELAAARYGGMRLSPWWARLGRAYGRLTNRRAA